MAALVMSRLSRREFVAGVLGAAALQHCRAAPAELPDGELLLPGKVAGHRLRDGVLAAARPARFEPASVMPMCSGWSQTSASCW